MDGNVIALVGAGVLAWCQLMIMVLVVGLLALMLARIL